jgi:hypothetical protein
MIPWFPIAAFVLLCSMQAPVHGGDNVVTDAPSGWNGEGRVVTPPSSRPQGPGREHTNTRIFVPRYDQPEGEQAGEHDKKRQPH